MSWGFQSFECVTVIYLDGHSTIEVNWNEWQQVIFDYLGKNHSKMYS